MRGEYSGRCWVKPVVIGRERQGEILDRRNMRDRKGSRPNYGINQIHGMETEGNGVKISDARADFSFTRRRGGLEWR